MAGLENRILNFDRGVEGVLFNQQSTEVRLPKSTTLTPWDGTVTARLEKMFQSPTRDEFLRNLLKPDCLNPSMLNPGTFRDMLKSCSLNLGQAAKHNSDLNDADELLTELSECEDLLSAYRNSLRQA